ncbi:MAG: Gfo/Idh/MocA family oxidoreductase [Kiritimatiellae bacterium]|nr:Gfo/Idh/MocA family oxidoreductase [Kiritimatiellia bacterium]
MMNRREFLGASLAGAASFHIGGIAFGQDRKAQLAQGARIRIAIIGCGSWGRTLLTRAGIVGGCEVAALCDPDSSAVATLKKQCVKTWGRDALDAAKVYPDYRVMFAEMGESLDAVFIATPNHHHALPALLAIRKGVNVYVEKPMAHTMEEVIRIGEEGRKAGVVVRVGNKGHNISHRPLLAQYLRDGAIGDITEVFSFSDRPNTMFRRPHTIPVPKGMDWDLWCGGSPVCEPYGEEDGRVGLHPHDWHSWIDYGNGSIGNMGTHVLDAPFQSMDMWKVTPEKIVVRDVKWGYPGAWNARGTMDFQIPARDGWGAITLHWNDGVADGVDISSKYMTGWYNRVYKRVHTNFPPELVELEKKWGVKKPIPAFGTVFVGTKGMIYEEFHRTLRFFPEGGKIADIPVPKDAELEVEERKIVAEFLSAVRGKPGPINTGLDFSIPLAKTLMLANMLAFAGKGTYAFDGTKTDNAVANEHAKHAYRKGWEIV